MFLNQTKLFTLKLKHYVYMMNSMRTCKNNIAVPPTDILSKKCSELCNKFAGERPCWSLISISHEVKLHHRFSHINLPYNSRVFSISRTKGMCLIWKQCLSILPILQADNFKIVFDFLSQ